MLLIDHFCGFEISLIARCQKVGVNEKQWHWFLGLLFLLWLPESLQDFNVPCNVRFEAVFKQKLVKIYPLT